jgi:thioredoxin-dependent peroxiredoxin
VTKIKRNYKPGGTMTAKPDTPAPHFSGLSDLNTTINLDDFKGKKLVLYFYPKDDTPGCTLEACGFRDSYDIFKALGTVVVGISQDSVQSHQRFKAKHELSFPLIADEGGEICKAYGVIKEQQREDKVYKGIERSTFLIDQEGIIRQVWQAVKVPGHIDEVLDVIKKLP